MYAIVYVHIYFVSTANMNDFKMTIAVNGKKMCQLNRNIYVGFSIPLLIS